MDGSLPFDFGCKTSYIDFPPPFHRRDKSAFISKVHVPKYAHLGQNMCMRCGDTYSVKHFCKALSRKCYKCQKYGHYANLCKSEACSSKVSSETEILNYSGSTRSSRIPSSKKSDSYDEKSYLCSLMPFSNIDNCDLKCVQFNSNSRVISRDNLFKKCASNKTLCGSSSDKSRKNVLSVTYSSDYETRIKELEASLSELQQQLELEESEHQEIERQNYLMCVEDIENLSTFVSSLYLMINPRNLHWQQLDDYENRKFYCEMCGSRKFHFAEQCAALRIDKPCKICNENGHLTVFCPNTNQEN